MSIYVCMHWMLCVDIGSILPWNSVINTICIDSVTGWKVGSSNLNRDKILFSFPKFPDLPCYPLCLQFRGFTGSYLGLNQQGPKLNHSSPSSAEVKNEWSYTAILLYVFREKLRFLTFVCYKVCVSTSTGNVVRMYSVENYTHEGISKNGRDSSVSLVTSYW